MLIQELLDELRAMESSLKTTLTANTIFNLIKLASRYPEGYESLLAMLNKTHTSIYNPLDFTFEDLFFYTVFKQNNPLPEFSSTKKAQKRHLLSTRFYDTFLSEPHVIIAGLHRTGTTWLFSIVNAIFTEGGVIPFEVKESGHNFLSPSERSIGKSFSLLHQLQLYGGPEHRLIGKAPHDDDVDSYFSELDEFLNARVINIVRDPRNVYLSGKAYFNNYDTSNSLVSSISSYLTRQQHYRKLCQEKGALELRYETLLSHPHAEIARLATFLQVSLSSDQVNTVFELTTFEKQAGGRPYGKLKNGDMYRGGSDWRKELNPAQKTEIHSSLGKQLESFGYS
jgi:hypothetical protein